MVPSKSKRNVIGAAAIFLVLAVGSFFAGDYLPYGFKHFREIHALRLGTWLSGWKNSGADEGKLAELLGNEKSSTRNVISPFATNFTYEGRDYESIVVLQSVDFGERGVLMGTTNAEVFWIGRDGKVDRLLPRRK